MSKLQEAIRDAIERSGKTRYRISKDSGVSASQLCRLVHGEKEMTVRTLERVADSLGLEIIVRPRGRRAKRS